MPSINMLEADLAVLVVVDVQEKMLGAISSSPKEELLTKMSALIQAAAILNVPLIYTEQYPQGLGATDASLKARLTGATGPLIKATCSCWRDEGFRAALQKTNREHVILIGLEAHVCIQQTALDLLRMDYMTLVAVDAVGSRFQRDYDVALERMRQAGVEMTTTEAILFELVERCDHPKFKDILKLVK